MFEFDRDEFVNLVNLVRPTVCLPGVNQAGGIWDDAYDGGNCCVGARLAWVLDRCEEDDDFDSGANEFARQMGCNRAHLVLMLRECGAEHDPFDAMDWPNPPEHVWDRLVLIEKFPSLQNQDLSRCMLGHGSLAGSDFSGSHMNSAKLNCADLSGCNFVECNLTDAVFYGSYAFDNRPVIVDRHGMEYIRSQDAEKEIALKLEE